MTLLLGPPGSGKTTLLLALAGKLDSELKVNSFSLFVDFIPSFKILLFVGELELHVQLVQWEQVTGKVTYNGHGMHEFVAQRTAAYIGQHDLHIGEMTVRETLAFSARCQGVGTRYGECHLT